MIVTEEKMSFRRSHWIPWYVYVYRSHVKIDIAATFIVIIISSSVSLIRSRFYDPAAVNWSAVSVALSSSTFNVSR